MDAQPPVPVPAAPTGRRRRRAVAAAAAAVVVAAGTGAVVAGTADASPPETGSSSSAGVRERAHVTGYLTPVPGSSTKWTVAGDFVGTYEITDQTIPQVWENAGYRTQLYVGTERMVGFLDYQRNGVRDPGEPRGTLRMAFQQLGTDQPSTGRFVGGYCVHPVTGATGAYRRGGILQMFDEQTGRGDEIITRYDGYLILR